MQQFINIIEQLDKNQIDNGTYCTEHSVKPGELELSISIDGCGNISFPLTNDSVEKMLDVAEQAKFGLRDQRYTIKRLEIPTRLQPKKYILVGMKQSLILF